MQPDDDDLVYNINLGRCLWYQKKLTEASNNLQDIIEKRAAIHGPEDTHQVFAQSPIS